MLQMWTDWLLPFKTEGEGRGATQEKNKNSNKIFKKSSCCHKITPALRDLRLAAGVAGRGRRQAKAQLN